MRAQLKNGDQIRMIQIAGDLGFALKPGQLRLSRRDILGGVFQHQLDRDDAVHQRIAGFIDNAKATTSDFAHDLIAPDRFHVRQQ